MRATGWLVASLLLAGCAGTPESPAEEDTGTASPAAEPATDLLDEGQQELPSTTTNITEFHWAVRGSHPRLAVEFVWDLGPRNDCTMLDANEGGETDGPDDIALVHQGDTMLGWGVGGSGGDLAWAHGGPIDTRTESSGGGGHASKWSGEVSGLLKRVWLLANPVNQGYDSFVDAEVGAALSLVCSEPFSLVSASTGPVGLMLDPSNLAGGAGAAVFVVGSAGVGDSAGSTMASPEVRLASGSFGSHAARVVTTTPEGSLEWLHGPTYPTGADLPTFFEAQGVAGDYQVEVDRAGAYLEAFWFGLWGIEGPLDLEAGLTPESVIIDPFED